MGLMDDAATSCLTLALLAQGGQKRVYAGEHPQYGSVVIKLGDYHQTTSLERVAREVGLLREINSPYYPKQFDFRVDMVERQFLIMEERLDAVELTQVTGRFNTDESILQFLVHLLRGFGLIWERRVVHRDIKPANILVAPTNEPRIIDLGIARFLDDVSLTASVAGQGPGTLVYTSPEQLLNRKRLINHRTDFFLLGILILQLMHGRHPFDPRFVGNQGAIVDNLAQAIYVPPAPNRDPRLVKFVTRCLERLPFRRFRDVSEIWECLEGRG